MDSTAKEFFGQVQNNKLLSILKILKDNSVTKIINRARINSVVSYANNRILAKGLAMLRSGADEQRIRNFLNEKANLYR